MIKHRSLTPKAIALSSIVAEIYAAARALTKAKGSMSLGQYLGEYLRVGYHVGAQPTMGLSHRSGFGKAHHIETAELWNPGRFGAL